jgi:hypothetical protein
MDRKPATKVEQKNGRKEGKKKERKRKQIKKEEFDIFCDNNINAIIIHQMKEKKME